MTFVSHTQDFEDVMLWRALRRVGPGFWVDAVAADPEGPSVTRAFSERGWRGINVQPAEQPLLRLRQWRPRDVNLQVAPAGAPNRESLQTADHATLAAICADHAPGPVHFMRISVGGHEKSVLSEVDFARVRPWIVLVTSTGNRRDEDAFPSDAGYSQVWFDGTNRFYLAKERAADLLSCFRTPPNASDGFVCASEVAARERAVAAEAELARATARAATLDAPLIRIAMRVDRLWQIGETDKAHAATAAMEARAVAAETQLNHVLRSKSWRMTRLLRSVVYRVRRLLRPLPPVVDIETRAMAAASKDDTGHIRALADEARMARWVETALTRAQRDPG